MPSNPQPELTEAQHGAILILRKEGYTYRQIAEKVGVSVSGAWATVNRVAKYRQLKSLPRSGRPRSISPAARREIVRYLRRYRFDTYKMISEKIGTVSERMVRKIAYEEDYRRRVARRKPFINEGTRLARLEWARLNRRRNWEGVAWVDETTIETGERPSHPRVTRKPNEAHLTECVAPTFRSGRESISVWGCVAHGYKGPLIRLELSPVTVTAKGKKRGSGLNAKGYAEQILNGPLPEFLDYVGKEKGLEMLVVEDGASAHRGKEAREAREQHGIKQLPHPPSSPDLNPIEPLWMLLKTRTSRIRGSGTNAKSLWDAAQEAWASITAEEVNMYTGKMVARVQAVLKAKGRHTEF